jgi:hypothetical protein
MDNQKPIQFGQPAATIAYAGYKNTIVRVYSTKGHRLISSRLGSTYVEKGMLLSLIAPTGFTISIGIAFLNPSVAQYFWVVMLIIHIIFQRRVKPQEP